MFELILFCSLSLQILGFGEGKEILSVFGQNTGDRLGTAVLSPGDLDGDGISDLVSGSPSVGPVGQPFHGLVVAFSGDTGEVIYEISGNLGDALGWSLGEAGDIDGDGIADYLVGAPGTHPDPGKVLAVSGVSGNVIYEVSGGGGGDSFGFSISSIGDIDGDLLPDFVVGAPRYDQIFNSTGGVFIFSGANGALIFSHFGIQTSEEVGEEVAGIGDVDGDGRGDIAFQSTPFSQGRVTVISTGSRQEIYSIDGRLGNDFLGFSISHIGDLDNDGAQDFAAGAVQVTSIPRIGYVLIISGLTGNIIRELQGVKHYEKFGHDVVGIGDINSDGVPDLAVGAPDRFYDGFDGAGGCDLYSGSDGSFLFSFRGKDDSRMGSGISSVRSATGRDGANFVAISSPFEDGANENWIGSIRVFSFNPFLTAESRKVSASSGGVATFFVDFPEEFAGFNYQIFSSSSEYEVSNFQGFSLPLARTPLLLASKSGRLGKFPGQIGTLDSNGNAMATLTVQPGQLSASLVGNRYAFVAVAGPNRNSPKRSSARLLVQVIP